MITLPVFSLDCKEVGKVDLDDSVFQVEIKPHVISDAVRYQMSRKYARKTAHALTRSEVKCTGKKIYKQKGTGQARHGDARAPIFVGGGKSHGPRKRLVLHKLNKKVRAQAIRCCLSLAQKLDKLHIVDRLTMEVVSSKKGTNALKLVGEGSILVINADKTAAGSYFNLSVRNLPGVKVSNEFGVNVFDLLKYHRIMMSLDAVKAVEERLKRVSHH